jgi:isoleucyl-tRNA synthetase
MDRIPDILDVWIDAGTTSWTCLDYPQKEEMFKKLWPADFILEGKDQIRGWFNLLLIASMVSMEKPSYKAVYMHGFVQDAKGRKMSKSLGNVISPYEVIDEFGADTLRCYMIGGANPGVDINYNLEDVKIKYKNMRILWNLHKYLIDLTNNYSVNPVTAKVAAKDMSIEEEYILSKLNSTISGVSKAYEEYRLNEIPSMIEELFLELSRTYIQLTRDKATAGTKKEKEIVAHTIYKVLIGSVKMFSTIAPFISEAIYQNLKEIYNLKEESVHLFDWPSADEKQINTKLEESVDIAQATVQSVLAAREKMQLGVRWPIKEIIVVSKNDKTPKAIEKLSDLIKTQTNVKNIKVQEELEGMKLKITADFTTLGPDFGELAPKIIAKVAIDSAQTVLEHIDKEGKYVFKLDGKEINLLRKHLKVNKEIPEQFEAAECRYCSRKRIRFCFILK